MRRMIFGTCFAGALLVAAAPGHTDEAADQRELQRLNQVTGGDSRQGALDTLLERTPPPAILTVVGGETFAALCRGLRAWRLEVYGELEPGVAASRMVDGFWRGTHCVSKSGAFGEPDWLLRHLGMIS